MNAHDLAAILVHTNIQLKMRKAMYLHFVKELRLAEAARQAGVQRQDAHTAAKRVRDIQALQSANIPVTERLSYDQLRARYELAGAKLASLREGAQEYAEQKDKVDKLRARCDLVATQKDLDWWDGARLPDPRLAAFPPRDQAEWVEGLIIVHALKDPSGLEPVENAPELLKALVAGPLSSLYTKQPEPLEQTPLDPQPQQPPAQLEPSSEQTPFGKAYGAWSIARLMLVMKYDEGTPEYDVQAAAVADLQERLYRVATVADWERVGECPSDWTPYQPPEQTPLERATNKLAYLKQMEPSVLADRDECRADLATLTPGSPEYSTTLDYIATAEEQLVAIRQQIHAAIDRVQDLTANIHT